MLFLRGFNVGVYLVFDSRFNVWFYLVSYWLPVGFSLSCMLVLLVLCWFYCVFMLVSVYLLVWFDLDVIWFLCGFHLGFCLDFMWVLFGFYLGYILFFMPVRCSVLFWVLFAF